MHILLKISVAQQDAETKAMVQNLKTELDEFKAEVLTELEELRAAVKNQNSFVGFSAYPTDDAVYSTGSTNSISFKFKFVWYHHQIKIYNQFVYLISQGIVWPLSMAKRS